MILALVAERKLEQEFMRLDEERRAIPANAPDTTPAPVSAGDQETEEVQENKLPGKEILLTYMAKSSETITMVSTSAAEGTTLARNVCETVMQCNAAALGLAETFPEAQQLVATFEEILEMTERLEESAISIEESIARLGDVIAQQAKATMDLDKLI